MRPNVPRISPARIEKLAERTTGDGQGREIEHTVRFDVGEHLEIALHGKRVRGRPCRDAIGGTRCHIGLTEVGLGQLAVRVVELVAERRARFGLPAVGARQLGDAVTEPVEA
jgi:hypothetical protein